VVPQKVMTTSVGLRDVHFPEQSQDEKREETYLN
jgi:hypothetical protein